MAEEPKDGAAREYYVIQLMRRRKIVWTAALGLVLALGGFVLLSANQLPRTHLSTTLKFLKGVQPVRSTYEKQGYFRVGPDGKRVGEVVALEEVFELPMSLDEVHKISREELKPISHVATYHRMSKPQRVVYGIFDKEVKDSVVVFITWLSPKKTQVMFKQTIEPTWLDGFFQRIRKAFRA